MTSVFFMEMHLIQSNTLLAYGPARNFATNKKEAYDMRNTICKSSFII